VYLSGSILGTFHDIPRRSNPVRLSLLVAFLAVLGVLARYYMAFLGHNYDLESWQIVAKLVNEGKNVYVHTWRYPYAPLWCYILSFLDIMAGHLPHPYFDFRHLVALFLSLMDVGIFIILFRKRGLLASLFFLFSPVSVLITGYHSQFDNLAILVALLGALILERGERGAEGLSLVEAFCFAFILALSLTIKHVFIFFPIWMALRSGKFSHRALFVTVPYVIFLASFIPFWAEGSGYIIHRVFLYRSFDNGVFYELFVPKIVHLLISRQGFFYIMLGAMAVVHRRKEAFESMIYYCAVILIFSSAIANQYLAIPLIFLAVKRNSFGIAYNIAGGMFLLVHKFGLNMDSLRGFPVFQQIHGYGYEILITLLLLAWLTSFKGVQSKVSAITDQIFRKASSNPRQACCQKDSDS
jgi:hypothetical protein